MYNEHSREHAPLLDLVHRTFTESERYDPPQALLLSGLLHSSLAPSTNYTMKLLNRT